MEIDLPVIEAGMQIGEIDLSDGSIEINPVNPIKFTCSLTGDCCSQLKIPVTDFDIKRIEDHGYELDQIISSASPLIRFSRNMDGSGERNYWIKQKPFVGGCTFLEDNKCSIHEFKPFGCRIFPFQLRELDDNRIKVVVHKSNLCNSVKAVSGKNANTRIILEGIRDTIIQEYDYRQDYIAEFGED